MENTYDVAIIGSGPSGLTAAIYTTRANLKTVVLAGRAWGGQLMLTTEVENFPGFPEGIMGPDLMANMRKQAEHHGAEIMDVQFTSGDFSKNPLELVTDDETTITAKAVLIATGAETKWLGVPGEKEKIGRGVSSCAPCDGAFYRNKRVIVVGGGDSAMEEAEVLTKFAKQVWVVHRGDALRSSKIMQDRVFANPKITVIFNTVIEEIQGELTVSQVKLKTTFQKTLPRQSSTLRSSDPNGQAGLNTQQSRDSDTQIFRQSDTPSFPSVLEKVGGKIIDQTPQELSWEFPIDGVFVAIGHTPNSKGLPGIETDEAGFIKAQNGMRTNMDRVFVAGDVHDHIYQQAITAAGYGCQAALEIERYLRDTQ